MEHSKKNYLKGRGAQNNPHNRFDRNVYEDWDGMDEQASFDEKTRFIEVFPKSIVNKVSSPDVGMDYSLNPYQGCEHGCTYCYARPTHEYWGYSPGVDFEKTILVKKNAPELLRTTLEKKNWKVKPIVLSGNTDCYQPCEQEFRITRKLLEIFLEYRHPVGIITKNVLMHQDLDLISELAKFNLISVNLSITSMDESLRRILEPRTATTARKLKLIEQLSSDGIRVNVLMAPIFPSLNDHEIFPIMKAVAEHGAASVGYIIGRLNGPNQSIFENWLELNFPERKEKVLNQLKDIHGGGTGSSQFGKRMRGEGNFAVNIRKQFAIAKRKYFKESESVPLRTDLFRIPPKDGQLQLFDQ